MRAEAHTSPIEGNQLAGGRKMQIVFMPFSLGRMQICIRLSSESRFGNAAGTTAVPCLEVTLMSAFGISSVRSTGAQSIPEQQSHGYQSWADAGVAEKTSSGKSRVADRLLMDMVGILELRFDEFPPKSRMLFSGCNPAAERPV
jgi:hypothetical protein